jgi:hypothetical protein
VLLGEATELVLLGSDEDVGASIAKTEEVADDAGTKDVVLSEVGEEELEPEVEELEFDPPPIGGGGTACVVSTRAPLPQGIAAPVLGCFASVGGMLIPDASAIVKRVVHDRLELDGLENW